MPSAETATASFLVILTAIMIVPHKSVSFVRGVALTMTHDGDVSLLWSQQVMSGRPTILSLPETAINVMSDWLLVAEHSVSADAFPLDSGVCYHAFRPHMMLLTPWQGPKVRSVGRTSLGRENGPWNGRGQCCLGVHIELISPPVTT